VSEPAGRRFVCLHGHFYQPPRENPWLDQVEREESAYPHSDWNRRITAECYAPNGRARILDPRGRIRAIVDNYRRLSFNFGPTLLSWLERFSPETYAGVLAADSAAREAGAGAGPAMAQAYNHAILPLCNERDRRTQVRWGVDDFRLRFGRDPQGMWLPETAVDNATLELLAEHGIRFTLLAPGQARSVREPGGRWRPVGRAGPDVRRAYRAALPSGRRLDLFFYDGGIAQRIAFERLLDSGDALAQSLLDAFDERSEPQLVHAATDGETYGHHHAHGEMALAAALARLERTDGVELTHYGRFLELAPARAEVRVREGSSWSCAHGVERWRGDCGCASEIHDGWRQGWRAPLREALDWLRDALAPRYEREAATLLRDPWQARDEYYPVLRHRTAAALDEFLARHARRGLTETETTRALQLLELQRGAMLMYTSCGWFFEELSRLETVQVLRYAARTVELAETLFEEPFEAPLVERLARAPSNVERYRDGAGVWRRLVRPARVDAARWCAGLAARLLVRDRSAVPRGRLTATDTQCRRWDGPEGELIGGRTAIVVEDTRERVTLEFAGLREADDSLRLWTRRVPRDGSPPWVDALGASWERRGARAAAAMLDRGFAAHGVDALVPDARRAALDAIARQRLARLARLHEDWGGPRGVGPEEGALRRAAAAALEERLVAALDPADFAPDAVADLLLQARCDRLAVDPLVLAAAVRRLLADRTRTFTGDPGDSDAARTLDDAVASLLALPLPVELGAVQDAVYRALERGTIAAPDDPALASLRERLGFSV
jgi:alpha-amylase/alpha-mannosidase (GH57 family)